MAGKEKAIKTEDDWAAESDARTLMEYVEIQDDSARMGKAQKALGKLEKEAKKASTLRKVATGLKASFPKEDK